MSKYSVEVIHRFIVETDDIDKVRENVEFTDFVGADDVEFVDGTIRYEEVSE
jgi:hypothetical protein